MAPPGVEHVEEALSLSIVDPATLVCHLEKRVAPIIATGSHLDSASVRGRLYGVLH